LPDERPDSGHRLLSRVPDGGQARTAARVEASSLEKALVCVIALVAALPSLVWAWSSAAYLSDDYWIAYWFDAMGIGEAMRRVAFDMPGRVLAAPYYLAIYQGIGARPLAQALVLAALNAGLVAAMWRLGRPWLPVPFVLTACAVFAVLPNRSSTRLWFVVGSYPLALLLVMVGVMGLARGRAIGGAVLLASAVALYEGVAGLAVLALVGLVVFGGIAWRIVLPSAALVAAAASAAYLLSSRRPSASGVGPFGAVDTFGSGLFGTGLTGERVSGSIIAVGLFAVIGLSLVTLLPGFRDDRPVLVRVRLGAALALAGAGPSLVGGAGFAVAGLGDRNNLVAGVGVAIVVAALLDELRRWRAGVGISVGVCVVAAMFALTMADVGSYARAADEGDEVLAALDASFPVVPPSAPTLIVPALDRSPGVAAFVPNIDIRGALHLRRGGDWSSIFLVETVDCSALDADDGWWIVDFEDQEAQRVVDGQSLVGICTEARTR